ncbi:MAG: DUF882 domain-containing protein [Desulfobacterales bacterium]|jgi:uncharacterized protein YcbK (DUF882 family)
MIWTGLISYSSKSAFAAIGDLSSEVRSLALFNTRTKEGYNGIYWRNGEYVASALENVNYIMRDIRTDDVKQIDTDLLDLIYKISLKLKTDGPFHILSGYRSHKTNSLLFEHDESAAKNSFHTKGQAVDIRLPGQRASVLRRAAFELSEGGIGYYPRQRFVHIDVGPVRYWSA